MYFFVFSEVFCPRLEAPPNACIVEAFAGPNPRAGAAVAYFCKPDFSLSSGSVTRVCMVNGEWDGEEPICIRKEN